MIKIDSEKETIQTSLNAFSFLMSNRHKQDEIIKGIVEKENESNIVCVDAEENTSECKDSDDCKQNRLDTPYKASSSYCIPGKVNAFQYLMLNHGTSTFENVNDEEYSFKSSKKMKNTKQCSNQVNSENLILELSSDDDQLFKSSKKVKNKKQTFRCSGQKKSKNLICDLSSDDSCNKATTENYINILNSNSNLSNSKAEFTKITAEPNLELESNDLKLNLINENEYFNIEETFKEEILECVTTKKKKSKRKDKLKKSRGNKVSEVKVSNLKGAKEKVNKNKLQKSSKDDFFFKEKENLIVPENVCSITIDETNTMNSTLFSQPDIKQFFKSFYKKVKSSDSIELENSVIQDNSKDSDVNPENLIKKNRIAVNKSSLKEKTKHLRNIRIDKHLTNTKFKLPQSNSKSDDDKSIPLVFEQAIEKTSNMNEDITEDCDEAPVVFEVGQETVLVNSNNQSDSDLNVGNKEIENCTVTSEEEDLLEITPRRSTRAVKQTDYFSPFYDLCRKKKAVKQSVKSDIENDFKEHEAKSNFAKKKNSSKVSDKIRCKRKDKCLQKKSKHESPNNTQELTDKKGKINESTINTKGTQSVEEVLILDSPPKDIKFAPIFEKKKPVVISPTKLKARTEFLFSTFEPPKKTNGSKSEESSSICPFPEYSHIKQIAEEDKFWYLSEPDIPSLSEEDFTPPPVQEASLKICDNQSIKRESAYHEPLDSFPSINSETMCHILAYLKNKNKEFPVISVFNAFKKCKEKYLNYYKKEYTKENQRAERKGESNGGETPKRKRKSPRKAKEGKRKGKSLSRGSKRRKVTEDDGLECEEVKELPIWHKWIPFDWNEVYAPMSLEFVIGNCASVISLKTWLSDWKVARRTESQGRNTSENSSDTSSSEDNPLNAVLITGSPGVGKSAMVYAIANEFGYRVLEVNASSCRQGKRLMSQLSEATQSHSVSSGSGSQMFCCKSVELEVKATDRVETTKSMSLILIEDIDIVFEEDEGFLSAVNALIATSKRPIVMTSSSCNASNFKIKEPYQHIILAPLDPVTTAQHLQLLCLANGVFTCSKEVELLIRENNCDIRLSISDLQFWILSEKCQVQWWKVDNAENINNAIKCEDVNDTNIRILFPWVSRMHSKSVEIPISLGCIWNKPNAKHLMERVKSLRTNSPICWSLLSANCGLILPFVRAKREWKLKYPLREDDSLLKSTNVWQKHSWLSLDDESDCENEALESSSKPEGSIKLKQSVEVERSSYKCVKSLGSYFHSLADFDIFSSYYCHSSKDISVNTNKELWWSPSVLPGLNSGNSKSMYCGYFSHVDLNLMPEVSRCQFEKTAGEISSAIEKMDVEEEFSPFKLHVEEDSSPFQLQPHSYMSRRQRIHQADLNLTLCSLLPFLYQIQRMAVVKDYLPYLREIARSDQLGDAIQRFKRGPNRRLLRNFRQLGFQVPGFKLVDICNVFQKTWL